MSERKKTPARLRLWKAAYTVIVEKLEADLQRDRQNGFRMSKKNRDHVEWRLGYNLYQAGRYFEATDKLKLASQGGSVGRQTMADRMKKKNALVAANDGKLIKDGAKVEEAEKLAEEIAEGPIMHTNFKVHRTAARCAVELFKETSSHYHLEAAHKHYENSIQNMPAGLVAFFTLPPLLFEFAKMCELYGAFQAALELYSKIITGFPNYRGYFDTMYRICLCGRHIAEVTKDPKTSDDLLNKSLDMLQFLLEAVPPTIEDSHIILLYSHALEISADPALRFRAAGAYQSMHDYYKSSNNPIAMTKKHDNFKDWYADPAVWLAIGDSMAEDGEPTLARDAYEVFYEKTEQLILFGDKSAKAMLSAPTCIRIAKTYACFQAFERAVKFGEMALKNDRFHKETRRLMSLWSKVHAVVLTKEQSAVDSIEDSWRSRVWSKKTRRKLTNMIVEDNEDKLLDDHLDMGARKQLEYYARDKWRATFLFEEECARRIQSNFREARKRWAWLQGIRAKYIRLASEAYHKFFRKPMDHAVRTEVRKVCESKFCPQKHALPRLIPLLDKQDASAECIRRSFQAYRRRKALRDRARQRFLDGLASKNQMVLMVQCLMRRKIAMKVMRRRAEKLRQKVKAATVIQAHIRKVNATFRGAAWRLICRRRWKHKQAARSISVILRYEFIHFKKQRAIWLRELRDQKRQQKEIMDADAKEALRHAMAKRLQHFAKACMGAALRKLAMRLLKERLKVLFSIKATKKLGEMLKAPASLCYSPPGIRQGTEQFATVLARQALCCSSERGFDHTDCVGLSTVLKHRLCRCTTLILHELDGRAASFEFDLLSGISQNRSLREVYILGGEWPQSFFAQLLGDIQIENPRISTIHLEGIAGFGACRLGVIDAVGRLLGDFFNYSLPGIREVCLHGCSLRTEDIGPILESLVLNASIVTLDLSLNLLEDDALLTLLDVVQTRPKSRLRHIGISWNHLKMDPELRDALNHFHFPTDGPTKDFLEVDVTFNSILQPYLQYQKNYRLLTVYNYPSDLHGAAGPESPGAERRATSAGGGAIRGDKESPGKPLVTLRELRRGSAKPASFKQLRRRGSSMRASKDDYTFTDTDGSETDSFVSMSEYKAWG